MISIEDAHIIKKIEREGYEGIPATNHDVKAVEYFIKLKLKGTSLEDVLEWVHFALTSEDVNSVAHGLALRGAVEEVMLPALEGVQKEIIALARAHAATPMLARTHGQPATPTTFGKEMNVFAKRLERQVIRSSTAPSWSTGAAPRPITTPRWSPCPKPNGSALARAFVKSLSVQGMAKEGALRPARAERGHDPDRASRYVRRDVRQSPPHQYDPARSLAGYVALHLGRLGHAEAEEGEVGSSAMPHKVNPIDFENAEGNFGVANALFEHLSRKLPVSRLQRDLSDFDGRTDVRYRVRSLAHRLSVARSRIWESRA